MASASRSAISCATSSPTPISASRCACAASSIRAGCSTPEKCFRWTGGWRRNRAAEGVGRALLGNGSCDEPDAGALHVHGVADAADPGLLLLGGVDRLEELLDASPRACWSASGE